MPNRNIKPSICTSENLNELTAEGERLFYRLLVHCDDFGRFDARPAVVRSYCFPLKVDSITLSDVNNWLQELEVKEIITTYQVNGKKYLYFNTFAEHNQKRAKFSKFPNPNGTFPGDSGVLADDSNSNQALADDSNSKHMIASDNLYDNDIDNDYDNDILLKKKKILKEKESVGEVFKIFEDNFQKISQTTTDTLNDLVDEYTADKVLEALKIAVNANKRNLRYVEGILKKNGTNKQGSKKQYTSAPDDPELDATD